MLLSTAYLPPVQYFCLLQQAQQAQIEACEHFAKQTYRSRCHILAANGVQILSVPIQKMHHQKMLIRDVQIDYSTHWQHQHWRALQAAYNASPFFLHYADDLRPFFEQPTKFLWDFNLQLLQKIMAWIPLSTPIAPTASFQQEAANDFRYTISPKCADNEHASTCCCYYQVFASRWGFVPNLSIVDLLFNEGNNAISVLQQSLPH
ncbi:hypothetical protein AGMMS4956_01240 [Bacteroidia bacterium]|nr:hypothetical protein AGMMS4956_01240 [Bacteroidia bacterium]